MDEANTQTQKPVVVLTGGNGYVGAAISQAFRAKGWEVASLSRTGDARIGANGFECDVTDALSVATAVGKIVERYGRIRCCIHAAASPLERVSILQASEDSIRETLNVAYLGAFHLSKAVLPHMEKNGAFIGITSRAIDPDASIGAMGGYVPAKYALRGFLRVLSADPATRGMRINAVAPGFLPGGLNNDLPNIVRNVIAKQSDVTATSVEELAAMVVRIAMELSAFPSATSIRFPSGETEPL